MNIIQTLNQYLDLKFILLLLFTLFLIKLTYFLKQIVITLGK